MADDPGFIKMMAKDAVETIRRKEQQGVEAAKAERRKVAVQEIIHRYIATISIEQGKNIRETLDAIIKEAQG